MSGTVTTMLMELAVLGLAAAAGLYSISVMNQMLAEAKAQAARNQRRRR